MHHWIKRLVVVSLLLTLGFVTYIFGYSVGVESATRTYINAYDPQTVAQNIFEPLPLNDAEVHIISGTVTSINATGITIHQIADMTSPYIYKNAPDITITTGTTTDLYEISSSPQAETFQKNELTLSSFSVGERIWAASPDNLRGRSSFEALSVYRLAR